MVINTEITINAENMGIIGQDSRIFPITSLVYIKQSTAIKLYLTPNSFQNKNSLITLKLIKKMYKKKIKKYMQ